MPFPIIRHPALVQLERARVLRRFANLRVYDLAVEKYFGRIDLPAFPADLVQRLRTS